MSHDSEHYEVTLALEEHSTTHAIRATWIAPNTPPFRDKTEGFLSDELRREVYDLVQAARQRSPNTSAEDFRQHCRIVGEKLWREVFPGRIQSCYEEAYKAARRGRSGLRIRLQIPPELESIPFELLFDASRQLFCGANLFTTLVRTTPSPPISPSEVDLPLKCLVVVAQPAGAPSLNVDRELDSLRKALRELCELGFWELTHLQGPGTLDQLSRRADAHSFHVLHFIGHGDVHPKSRRSCLVFEDEGGRPELVDSGTLAPVLSGYSNLSLLVINACMGARATEDRPYASIPHELLSLNMAAVVAMHREIGDEAALVLAKELYRSLADGASLDRAVNKARWTLHSHQKTAVVFDWFNPQLYLRATSGQLFQVRQSQLPWEETFRRSVEAGRLGSALELLQKAAHTTAALEIRSERIASHAERFAEEALRKHAWADLRRVTDARAVLNFTEERATEWRRVADNRAQWETDVRGAIQAAVDRNDLLQLSLALERCDRLIHGIVHDDDDVRSECYGGDKDLRDRFWAQDVEELRRLKKPIGATPYRGRKLLLLRIIDQLERNGGRPTDEPLGAECGTEPANRLLSRALAWHPVRNGTALLNAREWLTRPGVPDGLSDEIEATTWRLLAEESPVVRWALGARNEAVAEWNDQVRAAKDPDSQLSAHHHLALAWFSFATAGRADEVVRQYVRRGLSSWAPLFSECVPDAWEYWRRVCGESLPVDYLSSGREQVLRMAGRLSPGPPSERPASPTVRSLQMIALSDNNDLGAVAEANSQGGFAEWAPWLDAEASAINRVVACAENASLTNYPLVGYDCVVRLELQSALQTFVRAWLSLASQSPLPEVSATARMSWDLRLCYSALRFAHLDLTTAAPAEQVLSRLAVTQHVLPPEVQRVVRESLGRITVYSNEPASEIVSDIAAANPLYALCDDAPGELAADWTTLFLRAWLQRAAFDVMASGPDLLRLDETVRVVESLRGAVAATEEVRRLQRVVLAMIDGVEGDPEDLIDRHLPILQVLARLGLNEEIRTAFSEGLLALSIRLIQNNHRPAALRAVSQALQWDANCIPARELLATALLADAHGALSVGNFALSAKILDELDSTLDGSPAATICLAEIRVNTKAVRARLKESPHQVCDSIAESSTSVDDVYWRERLREATTEMAGHRYETAFEHLCDAALLAPETGVASQQICEGFLRLAAAAAQMETRQMILQKANELLGHDESAAAAIRDFSE